MLKLEKGQTVTKTAEETAVALDGDMIMDAKLIGKFITQQVAVAMDEKSREYVWSWGRSVLFRASTFCR